MTCSLNDVFRSNHHKILIECPYDVDRYSCRKCCYYYTMPESSFSTLCIFAHTLVYHRSTVTQMWNLEDENGN